MLDLVVIDPLFPGQWERRHPSRALPPGAELTRSGPSPIGFVHSGAAYRAGRHRPFPGAAEVRRRLRAARG